MDAAAVEPRPTTYTFYQYEAGVSPLRGCSLQDADVEVFLSPSPRSPSPSRGESSPLQTKAPPARGLPRQRRKRPRSWSTPSTNNGTHVSLSPATGAAFDSPSEQRTDSPIEQGDSPQKRGNSMLPRGADERGGFVLPIRTVGADVTASTDAGQTRGRPLGDDGIALVDRDATTDDAPRTREKGGGGGSVVDDDSLDGAEDKEADDGPSRTRDGAESGQSQGRERGRSGIGTRGARQQQQQQQTVHVVVHEVLSEDFGLFTWPSGVLLAYLIWARRREFRGVSVVEIGAGTALPGLLAAKLGAKVLLTDREGAPWVLENMRGAVEANGLLATADDATIASAAAAAAAAATDRDAGRRVTSTVGDNLRDTDVKSDGDTASTGEKRSGRGAGNGVAKEEGGSAEGTGGGLARGSCSVRGLSWGSVGPASIKLAREQWRPQVVLGADVFYSSEHFDSVLATAFMLLSAAPCSSGGVGGSCNGAAVDVDVTGAASFTPSGVGSGTADPACSSVSSPKDADAAAVASASAAESESTTSSATTPPNSSLGPTTDVGGNNSTSSVYGSPFSRSKGVFLTAYHERSARRSLRPLLKKWGMEARVLHEAPRKVLPPPLWESGRYDSVALLEITLMQ